MELVRQWLLGITCAALLAAVVDALMPKGAVKQVGKVVCGLVLLCAVLRPLTGNEIVWDTTALHRQSTQQLNPEQGGERMLKTLIERECGAYIVDKAAEQGVTCQAQVECEAGQQGVWLPSRVKISGQAQERERNSLCAVICREFGIAPEQVTWAGGE